MATGHSFVIRAGANVRLLKRLGYVRERDNTVYLWPNSAAEEGLPPLVLRMVWVHNGKHPMCLVTNVLSKTRLSDRKVAEIYKARWGVEVFFRTFKQTFGRQKWRSHKAEKRANGTGLVLGGLVGRMSAGETPVGQSRPRPMSTQSCGGD